MHVLSIQKIKKRKNIKEKQATLVEEYTECSLVGHISKTESLIKGLAWTNDKCVRNPGSGMHLKNMEQDYRAGNITSTSFSNKF